MRVNEVASKDGSIAFQFNTYIIAVLVLFFLQVKYDFPKIAELPSTLASKKPIPLNGDLGKLVREFFEFYAKVYEVHKKVISLNVGRWQDRENPSHQKIFSPEQKRFNIFLVLTKILINFKVNKPSEYF